MVIKVSLAIALAGAVVMGCASSGKQEDTYLMQKGGMSSTTHTMKSQDAAPATQEDEADTVRKDKKVMQKGGMSSTTHTMK